MSHQEISKKFIDFFVAKGHLQIPQASLVTEGDPTLLFINSGMAPLKDYFLGRKEPPAKRLCNIQRCLRTEDLDKVGRNRRSLTLFEMMGTWSISDYFKEEAIALAWEFLTGEINLDPNRLWPTVFAGNEEIEKDKESIRLWQKVGVPKERIIPLPASSNLWVSGPTGPFGPCSEMYYDRGEKYGCGKKDCKPGCDCDRFLEIWNPGVFMMYNRKEDGSFEELPFKSVDTGAGLERFALVLQSKESVFETDLLLPIYEVVADLAEVGLEERPVESLRIITDHARAVTFLIADGVTPSNKDRGYVLRRLIRRAVRHGALLKIDGLFLNQPVKKVIEVMGEEYPHLLEKEVEILRTVGDEERKFGQTLKRGLRELEKTVSRCQSVPPSPRLRRAGNVPKMPGEDAFQLYDTYGFPLDLTVEIAKEKGFAVDTDGFEKEMEKQQERARAAQKFDKCQPEEIAPLHTAAHLLNQSLREVLGGDVHQAGQDLTPERLRFDFTFDRKLEDVELKKIEEIVNDWIKKDVPVECVETTYEEAVKAGAEALFAEKYKEAEKVTLYKIGGFSKELCAGPHVKSTGELKVFKIIKQESVGREVRRIYGILPCSIR